MSSSTARRHRMRCGHKRCATRFTLRQHPDQYVRAIRCPACKSYHVYSCEAARRREVAKQKQCNCNAYPFTHRAGSMRMCDTHPQADTMPTPGEIEDYESCLATPRSGYM